VEPERTDEDVAYVRDQNGAERERGGASTAASIELHDQVTRRYLKVNGDHRMSAEDDTYVNEHFLTVEALARQEGIDAGEIRRLMLARRMPLPSYLRSDGAQMVPVDLFALAHEAGGAEHLPDWFASQFDDPATGGEEWEDYLSGQYVCLRRVTPETIKRKDQLCDGISRLLEHAQPQSDEWLATLHELVDELDRLVPPFAPYDRLRFDGPLPRDELITDVRRQFPLPQRPAATPPTPKSF
jgi:hypothetical protein